MYIKFKVVVRSTVKPFMIPLPALKNAFTVGDDVIDLFGFGSMVIGGHRYTSDLIIYPDGRVREGWRRSRGHVLTKVDLQTVLATGSEVIIVGTGIYGRMQPEPGLEKALGKMGIHFMAGPNDQAVTWYNDRSATRKVGACFHLSC